MKWNMKIKILSTVLLTALVALPTVAMHRLARIAGHAAVPVSRPWADIVAVGTGATRESLRHALLSADIKAKWGAPIAKHRVLIGAILRQEELHDAHYYPLYHAQMNGFRALQEFLRLAYEHEFGVKLPKDFIFLRWWHGCPTAPDVQSYLDSKGGSISDNQADIADALLSTNLAFFGNTANQGSSSFDYFLGNSSMFTGEPRIKMLLESMLRHYGFDPKHAQAFIDYGKEIATQEGNILQIFVPKKDIDRSFYICCTGGSHVGKYTYEQSSSKGTVVAAADFDARKNRYIRASGIMEARLTNAQAFNKEQFDKMQGRLYIHQHILNPNSGVKVVRYTTVSAEKMALFQQKCADHFERMSKEKNGGEHKEVAAQHIQAKL